MRYVSIVAAAAVVVLSAMGIMTQNNMWVYSAAGIAAGSLMALTFFLFRVVRSDGNSR